MTDQPFFASRWRKLRASVALSLPRPCGPGAGSRSTSVMSGTSGTVPIRPVAAAMTMCAPEHRSCSRRAGGHLAVELRHEAAQVGGRPGRRRRRACGLSARAEAGIGEPLSRAVTGTVAAMPSYDRYRAGSPERGYLLRLRRQADDRAGSMRAVA